MKRINDWMIDSYGCIRGQQVDADSKFVTVIRTSRVVKREGNVVVTKNESRYELLKPANIQTDQAFLEKFFDGAADPLAAIDYRILNHD